MPQCTGEKWSKASIVCQQYVQYSFGYHYKQDLNLYCLMLNFCLIIFLQILKKNIKQIFCFFYQPKNIFAALGWCMTEKQENPKVMASVNTRMLKLLRVP